MTVAGDSGGGGSGRKSKRSDVDESYHQQPQLVKDHEGKLRRFKLSHEVVQQPTEQAGSSSAAVRLVAQQQPVVFELVESSKLAAMEAKIEAMTDILSRASQVYRVQQLQMFGLKSQSLTL